MVGCREAFNEGCGHQISQVLHAAETLGTLYEVNKKGCVQYEVSEETPVE